MIDIKLVRNDPEGLKKNLAMRKNKKYMDMVDEAIKLDEDWRKGNIKVEQLRARRNSVSKEIAQKKKAGDKADDLIKEAGLIPKQIEEIEGKSLKLKEKLAVILMKIPNLLHESVPTGKDDSENIVVKEVGKKTKHAFETVSHTDLLEQLGMADFAQASKVSGARFYYLKGDLVRLELALQMFALDTLSKKGYTPVLPPYLLRREPYQGVTDLSDFEDVLYKIEGEDLFLIATSEHSVAAMQMGKTIEAKDLPLKYLGISPCFRKEAGTHGKDTKGIFRVHHFNKIEQFVFCTPEVSWKIFDELMDNAETLFKLLELPYQIVNICTGDIGTVAAKKYDLEVWMPTQQKYREAVSCSNCTDYQARRLNIKYTDKDKKEHLHTLNSTAIATTRVLVAILENFQEKDGSVKIPKALVPYIGTKKLVSING